MLQPFGDLAIQSAFDVREQASALIGHRRGNTSGLETCLRNTHFKVRKDAILSPWPPVSVLITSHI